MFLSDAQLLKRCRHRFLLHKMRVGSSTDDFGRKWFFLYPWDEENPEPPEDGSYRWFSLDALCECADELRQADEEWRAEQRAELAARREERRTACG